MVAEILGLVKMRIASLSAKSVSRGYCAGLPADAGPLKSLSRAGIVQDCLLPAAALRWR
jgi:hypothetical protein